MRPRVPSALCPVWALLAVLATAAGCSKQIVIYQVPSFWSSDLKTVAVVPFRNHTGSKDAGTIVADRLAAALAANGTYKVYNRNDLSALMEESDLRIALGADPAKAASALKKVANVQAILTGAVTTYAATSNSQRKREPQYVYVNGQCRLAGHKVYTFTRNEANVAVTAALIRVSDGSTCHSVPAGWNAWAQGAPPKYDVHACAAAAGDNVVAQLVEQFAVIRKKVKVDPDKALRICREKYDGQWIEARDVRTTDEEMFVVVDLPPACDRNRFRIAVVRKDRREALASLDIRWSRGNGPGGQGYRFSPRQLARRGGGAGQYEVKFYSGQEPVLRRSFEIRGA